MACMSTPSEDPEKKEEVSRTNPPAWRGNLPEWEVGAEWRNSMHASRKPQRRRLTGLSVGTWRRVRCLRLRGVRSCRHRASKLRERGDR